MSLNINALPVSIGGIVAEFHTPATAVGAAIVAHSVAVAGFERSLVDNSAIPPALIKQVDLDRANFVSNDRLKDMMTGIDATPEQIAEALRINAEARLRALELSFLLLAGAALLMISPVGRLPDHVRGAAGPEPMWAA